MKKCPFCAEEIQIEAIKCKHCGEFLDGRPKVVVQAEPAKTSWFFKPASIVLSILTIGPLALPLIWFHPTYSKNKKIVITLVVAVISYYLGVAAVKALKTLTEYYQGILSM